MRFGPCNFSGCKAAFRADGEGDGRPLGSRREGFKKGKRCQRMKDKTQRLRCLREHIEERQRACDVGHAGSQGLARGVRRDSVQASTEFSTRRGIEFSNRARRIGHDKCFDPKLACVAKNVVDLVALSEALNEAHVAKVIVCDHDLGHLDVQRIGLKPSKIAPSSGSAAIEELDQMPHTRAMNDRRVSEGTAPKSDRPESDRGMKNTQPPGHQMVT